MSRSGRPIHEGLGPFDRSRARVDSSPRHVTRVRPTARAGAGRTDAGAVRSLAVPTPARLLTQSAL
jgi:hypothetical protein